MAKIALRVYTNEISDLIENNQLEEAVAHCLHILEEFPRHIATYRLLGKAHLEGKQYRDASDIFQRVLSSVPDDFIANVGMSIIREATGDLPAAIYHMERTFESQPSNQLIQEELRRLYGVRDGVQPAKTRLTRGALAHMYALGNLYDQAAAELIAALSEEPHRLDLYVLLAEMYFKLNKNKEAIETSKRIIENLPYSLTANRILYLMMKDQNKPSEAEAYFERWISMEPYAEFISDSYPIADYVPEHMVTLEKLELSEGLMESGLGEEGTMPEADYPAPSADSETSEELPSWLDTEENGEIGEEDLNGVVPDWLSDLKGEDIDQSEDEEEQTELSDLHKAQEDLEELPDWINSSYPPEEGGPEKTEEISDGLEDISGRSAGEGDQELPAGEPAENLFDFLETDQETSTEKTEEAIPEWLDADQETSTEETEEPIPDWLEEDKGLSTEETEEAFPEWLDADQETSADDTDEDILNRLDSDQEHSTAEPEETPHEPVEPGQEPSDEGTEEDLFDSLDADMAALIGEQAVEEVQDKDLPEWVKLPSDTAQQLINEILTEPGDENEIPLDDLLQSLPEPGESPESDDTPDWLNDIPEPDSESETVTLLGEEEETIEEIPEFSSSQPEITEDDADEPEELEEPEEEEASTDQNIPEWVKHMTPLEESPLFREEETSLPDIPGESSTPTIEEQIGDTGDEVNWLNELGEPTHAPPAQPIYTDWLETYQRFEEKSGENTSPEEKITPPESEPEQEIEQIKEPVTAETEPEEEVVEEAQGEAQEEGQWSQGDWLQYIPLEGSPTEEAEEPEEIADSGQKEQRHKTQPLEIQKESPHDREWLDKILDEEETPSPESSEPEGDADNLFDEGDLDWIDTTSEEKGKQETPSEKVETDLEIQDEEQTASSPEEEGAEEDAEEMDGSIEKEIEEEFEWIESLPDSPESTVSEQEEQAEDWIGSLRDSEDFSEEESEPAPSEPEDIPQTEELTPEEWLDSFEKETDSEATSKLDEEDLGWIEALEKKLGSAEEPELQDGSEIDEEVNKEEVPTETLTHNAVVFEEIEEEGRGTLDQEVGETEDVEDLAENEETTDFEKPAEPADNGEETPTWLKNLTEQEDENKPSWLVNINRDADTGELAGIAAPSSDVDEWLKYLSEPEQANATGKDVEDKPEQETEQQQEEEAPERPAAKKEVEVPADLGDMIEKCTYLIRKGRDLEEVIDTIQATLEEHPRDSRLWQMLGDGYMRLDRLKEALDAYTKAEELL